MDSFESVISDQENLLKYPSIPVTTRKLERPTTPEYAGDIKTDALVHHLEDEKFQKEFTEKKSTILSLLESTRSLVQDFSSADIAIEYPLMHDDANGRQDIPGVNFHVLKLELRTPGKNFNQDVLYSLNSSSLSQLLTHRFADSLKHLDRIQNRVEDTFSKVLITGDLNSGKSTFINSLMRRDILPSDQQPCTTMFCEVLSSDANNGEEGVHGISDSGKYDVNHLKTYSKFNLDHIKVALTQEESTQYNLWKVYCDENRAKNESLLSNGLIDLVFIDSPGLNRDFSHTMAVFSQHEEIDAVIFVVNSENHFTLSGVEFLGEARKEKPHMFVVVNRFDVIKDKDRCRQNILKQIEELLPETAEQSDELVHFVSAREFLKNHLAGSPEESDHDYAFFNLESCLRSFLLEKRLRTKLAPAKIYLTNILSDMNILAGYNENLAIFELENAQGILESAIPEFANLTGFSEKFEQRLEKTMSDALQLIQLNSQLLIDKFVANIGEISQEVSYPGILGLWRYADAIIRNANLKLMAEFERHDMDVHLRVSQDIKNLYAYPDEQIKEWKEHAGVLDVYLPAAPPCMGLDIREHQYVRVDVDFGDFMEIPSNLANVGAAVGAVSIIGGGIIGYRRVMSGLYHVGSVAGPHNMTRVFWGVVGVVGIAATAFVLHDAPNTVQRKLVRKIRRGVKKSDRVHKRLYRTGHHARKSLEKSCFEFKKNVCKVVELKEKECREQESKKLESLQKKTYFGNVKQRAGGLLELLQDVHVDEYRDSNVIRRK